MKMNIRWIIMVSLSLCGGCEFGRGGVNAGSAADGGLPSGTDGGRTVFTDALKGPITDAGVSDEDARTTTDQGAPDQAGLALADGAAPGPDAAPHPDATEPPPDSAPAPDVALPPDTAVLPGPISITDKQLEQALHEARVPCVATNGEPKDGDTPVAEGKVVLFDGAVTLEVAGEDTNLWAGSGPSVTVVWNPQACQDDDWKSAGLLIRGAELHKETLTVAPGTTIADVNVVEVTSRASWEEEYGLPDDSALPLRPQFYRSLVRAKELVIELAFGTEAAGR